MVSVVLVCPVESRPYRITLKNRDLILHWFHVLWIEWCLINSRIATKLPLALSQVTPSTWHTATLFNIKEYWYSKKGDKTYKMWKQIIAEANRHQNDSLCKLSAHFRFCVFWRSLYPQLTAANMGVSEFAMNDFVPWTSIKKHSTTVSSNIIACRHELCPLPLDYTLFIWLCATSSSKEVEQNPKTTQ